MAANCLYIFFLPHHLYTSSTHCSVVLFTETEELTVESLRRGQSNGLFSFCSRSTPFGSIVIRFRCDQSLTPPPLSIMLTDLNLFFSMRRLLPQRLPSKCHRLILPPSSKIFNLRLKVWKHCFAETPLVSAINSLLSMFLRIR